jgi:hypothetical protein
MVSAQKLGGVSMLGFPFMSAGFSLQIANFEVLLKHNPPFPAAVHRVGGGQPVGVSSGYSMLVVPNPPASIRALSRSWWLSPSPPADSSLAI